jgi:hypothetical protein
MSPNPMAAKLARILARDPQLAFDFYCAASEIVDDFEDYGPVLQANEDGAYDDSTTIIQLRDCRARIYAALYPTPKS